MLKLFLLNFRTWQTLILFMITLPFFHLEPIFAERGIVKKYENDQIIVFLITTPNMKPSGPIRGDYDRVKRAIATEFKTELRGFSDVKNAFVFSTNTEDSKMAEHIKAKILSLVNDAKIETLTMGELKKLRL